MRWERSRSTFYLHQAYLLPGDVVVIPDNALDVRIVKHVG